MDFGNFKYMDIRAIKVKTKEETLLRWEFNDRHFKENKENFETLNKYRVIKSFSLVTDKGYQVSIDPVNCFMNITFLGNFIMALTNLDIEKNKIRLQDILVLNGDEKNDLAYFLYRVNDKLTDIKENCSFNYIKYILGLEEGKALSMGLLLKVDSCHLFPLLYKDNYLKIYISPNASVANWGFDKKYLQFKVEKDDLW